jgi:hypothetical protein
MFHRKGKRVVMKPKKARITVSSMSQDRKGIWYVSSPIGRNPNFMPSTACRLVTTGDKFETPDAPNVRIVDWYVTCFHRFKTEARALSKLLKIVTKAQ